MAVTRKILGRADLAATTNTSLYTGGGSTTQVIASINICNRNATGVTIRISISDTGTPALADYLEYDTVIPGNGVLERTGICLEGTKRIVVYSSGTGVSAVAYGQEQT